LNKQQYTRLVPFLHRKGDMSRVILYLIAKGYTFIDLLAITVKELRAMEMPDQMKFYRDTMLDGHKTGPAFIYPSGKPVRETDFKRLVRESTHKVLGHPISREAFRSYIVSSSKKRKA
jgi:hypothetical protein